jgi:S1-C subfamily serine protease
MLKKFLVAWVIVMPLLISPVVTVSAADAMTHSADPLCDTIGNNTYLYWGSTSYGSAFPIHSWKGVGTFFLTVNHVVANNPGYLFAPWSVTPIHVIRVVSFPGDDTAIVETEYLPGVHPFLIAQTPPNVGDAVMHAGFGAESGSFKYPGEGPSCNAGSVTDYSDDEVTNSAMVVVAFISNAISSDALGLHGDSGGPLVNLNGDVVGIDVSAHFPGGTPSQYIPWAMLRVDSALLEVSVTDQSQ